MAINDSTNLIIPSGIFKAHATLPGANPEKPDSYTIDFGKFENGSLKVGGELKEHFGVLATGGLGLDAKRRVKASLSYEFDQKHFSAAMLAYVFGTAAGSAPQPGKVVDLFGYVAMVSPGEGIDGTSGSAPVVHHSFKAAVYLDGDLAANGSDFASLKLRVDVYLAVAPGVWNTTRT